MGITMSEARTSHAEAAPLSAGQLAIWNRIRDWGAEVVSQASFLDAWSVPDGTGQSDAIRAFDTLVSRHEIMRTYYSAGTNPDEARQVIHDHVEYDIDLIHANGEQWEDQVAETLARYRQVRIDITEQLSWKAALILANETPKCLVFVGHHIAVDPFALTILKDEFTKLVNGCDSSELGNALQPRELAAIERSDTWLKRTRKATEHKIRSIEKLAERLRSENRDAKSTHSETDHMAQPDSGILVSDITSRQLDTIASQYKVTPASLILSLWIVSISRLANVSFVPIGLGFSNRVTPQMRTLVCNLPGGSVITTEVPDNAQFAKFSATVHGLSITAQRYALNDPIEPDKLLEILTQESPTFPVLGGFQHQSSPPEIKFQENLETRKTDEYREAETSVNYDILRQLVDVKFHFNLISRIRYGHLELSLNNNRKTCESLAYSIRKNLDLVRTHSDISLEALR